MNPKVSVLVPIYNVSDYIERCAHSLFQQTFDDIEYVFVNDCTPDDSIEKLQKIIEQYPNRKAFVKIINHEKNRGLAAARNTAINNALGKYIQHIDSDDWVELDMIETLYAKAETEQADIVVSDIFFEYKNKQEIARDFVSEDKDENIKNAIEQIIVHTSLCSKLVLRKLFRFSYPENLICGEDRLSLIKLYFFSNKIVTTNKAFYHYDKTNENSITAHQTEFHFQQTILFWNLLDDFLEEKGISEKFSTAVEYSKTEGKVSLITIVGDYKLRKKYAYLFRYIEMKYIKRFRRGEKLILFFTHYRMYCLAHLVQKLIVLKNS